MLLTTKRLIEREKILQALVDWVDVKPGLSLEDYGGDRPAYGRAQRKITQQKKDALRMIAWIGKHQVDPVLLADAFTTTNSGRLSLADAARGPVVEYVAGQSWPDEYRYATCLVLARAIRDHIEATTDMSDIHEGVARAEILHKAMRAQFDHAFIARWML